MAPTPEPLRTDLRGRVERSRLPDSDGMMAVFEAVVNSIQSVEDLPDPRKGRITVEILRQLPQVVESGKTYPVTGFRIVDNGLGFNDTNYESFKTSDSRKKQALGGKGIGRLVWLKVFGSIEVDSVYDDVLGSPKQRGFTFSVDGVLPRPSEAGPQAGTRVTLTQPDPAYSATLQGTSRAIALRILEHCLVYLIDEHNAPHITVSDGVDDPLLLSNLLAEVLAERKNVSEVNVGSQKFRLVSTLMRARRNAVHRVCFCANKRLVKSVNLNKFIPDLTDTITLVSGEKVAYVGYLVGDLLDSRVYPDRDDFWLGQAFVAEEKDSNSIEIITFEDIAEGAAQEARKFLEPHLAPMRESKAKSVYDYVEHEAPQFRYLLERHRDEVLTIKSASSKQAIHQHLSVIEFKHDQATTAKLGEALSRLDGDKSADDYAASLDAVLGELSDSARSKLARYVLYRRTIIGILEKCSKIVPGSDKTKLESAVHQVVFPMRKSSADVPFLQNNLWLVDERLSFHQFLASDLRLNELGEVIEVESEDRPDLAIFQRTMAFAEADQPFQSIILIDFKRPARGGYQEANEETDPILQMTRYIQKLRAGKVRDKGGAFLRIPDHVPFYAFLVADISPSLADTLGSRGFTPTPDGEGHYWYNTNIRAYFEVMTYRKLIRDAHKRNHAFVHMLGLPMSSDP